MLRIEGWLFELPNHELREQDEPGINRKLLWVLCYVSLYPDLQTSMNSDSLTL